MEKNGKIEFRKEQKQINYWKWTTLALIAVILAFCFVVGIRVSQDREKIPTAPSIAVKGSDIFTVSTTKKELNTLISHYLKQVNQKNHPEPPCRGSGREIGFPARRHEG